MRAFALSCLLIAAAALPRPVRADEPPAAARPATEDAARAAYERGMQLYRERAFEAAAAAFAESFARDPRRETLFAQAQANRLAGRCELAVPLYERFLELRPSAQQIEATRLALARCAEQPAAPVELPPPRPAAVPTEPPSARPPTVASPVVAAPVPSEPTRSWRVPGDRLAAALVLGGVVAAGVGGALVASARGGAGEPRTGESLDAYADRRDGAETRLRVGVGAIVVGAAAAIAGVGRGVWLAVHPHGAALALQVRWP